MAAFVLSNQNRGTHRKTDDQVGDNQRHLPADANARHAGSSVGLTHDDHICRVVQRLYDVGQQKGHGKGKQLLYNASFG